MPRRCRWGAASTRWAAILCRIRRDGSKLLYYHNGANAPNDLWVYDIASKQSQQITHALVGGLRSADMVRAVSGALSQPRRQVDDLGVRLCAQQHSAQRQVSCDCVHSRRAGGAVGRLVQSLHPVHREPGLSGDRAELSRLDRIRQAVHRRQHGRCRRAGVERRARRGGVDQEERLRRSQEADRDGRKLRRLSQHDGGDQGSGDVGGSRADRAVRELVHRDRERGSAACASTTWRPWAIR